MRHRTGLSLAALALIVASCSGPDTRLVVAAGTTVVDSGFLDRVVQAYEESHPDVRVSVVGQPTRLALALGRDGAADVTITHAPTQEEEFVDGGGAVMATRVFSSVFLLAGPPSLAEAFRGYEMPEVLREVVEREIPFVSRADGSGTFDKEWENWIEAGLDPRLQDWYIETGQGMGPTLLVADQREALVLVEVGALLAAAGTVTLSDLGIDPAGLENPYTAMVMAASGQQAAAIQFVEWLGSPSGIAAINSANAELFGTIVYSPAGQS